MSGLSTKNVKAGGGLPKTIEPGVQVLKINNVRLAQFPFMEADNGYFLMLDVETRPIPDFEGFFIDKDDESKGRWLGQIGQIKTNKFYYKDGETKTGIKVSRNMDILKQLKNICVVIGCVPWFDAADDKYATIELLVDAFNVAAPYKDKYFKFCVAGKEFEQKTGYTGYDLFFPKLGKGKVAMEAETVKVSKLVVFDPVEHIAKATPKEVSGFAGDAGELPPGGPGADIKGPEFKL